MKFEPFYRTCLSSLRVRNKSGYIIAIDNYSGEEILNAEIVEFRAVTATMIEVILNLE